MRTFTRTAALLVALVTAAPTWAAPPAPAARPGVRGVGPDQFGRVFQRARRSIVQVRTIAAAARFDIGTFIGARGELVVAARTQPPAVVSVTLPGGGAALADVLAYTPGAQLAVARLRDAHAEPLDAADPPDVALEQWLVSVRLDARGEPEPFAGVVEGTSRPWRRDRALELIDVGTPAEPGSPILTTDGRLIAIAVERGARRTQAVLLVSLLPFLRQAVLGP